MADLGREKVGHNISYYVLQLLNRQTRRVATLEATEALPHYIFAIVKLNFGATHFICGLINT